MGSRYSKGPLLIHSTFLDLPFLAGLCALSECPMTSIATAKLPGPWNAGDLHLVLCCKANGVQLRACHPLFCRLID